MDYAKLRGCIRAKYATQAAFARDMCMSECALSLKLNGHSEWTADEMRRACDLLGIPMADVHLYFFCAKS